MTYYTSSSVFSAAATPTPWVKRLLIANAGVFLLAILLGQGFLFRWFAFVPGEILLRPWSVVTYLFLHANLSHLLMNMLVLFFFGRALEERWGGAGFLTYYLVCGLGAVALSFLLSGGAAIVGASGAIYGLMMAFAMLWPDAPVHLFGVFPVKAKWLVAGLVAISLLSAPSGGGTAHFAHLGGLLTGYLFLRVRRDFRGYGSFLTSAREMGSAGPRPGGGPRLPRVTVVSRDPRDEPRDLLRRRPVPAQDPPPEASWSRDEEESLLDRVDRVLDKISAEGMAALSEEERKLLDEVSRRRRTS